MKKEVKKVSKGFLFENYVMEITGGKLAPKNQKNFDVIASNGEKIECKLIGRQRPSLGRGLIKNDLSFRKTCSLVSKTADKFYIYLDDLENPSEGFDYENLLILSQGEMYSYLIKYAELDISSKGIVQFRLKGPKHPARTKRQDEKIRNFFTGY